MTLPNDIRIEIRDYNGNEILFQENFFSFEAKKDLKYILSKVKSFLEEKTK